MVLSAGEIKREIGLSTYAPYRLTQIIVLYLCISINKIIGLENKNVFGKYLFLYVIFKLISVDLKMVYLHTYLRICWKFN